MSALPDWLWPIEDEEAVQEAERLIEETHNALRRMEADMNIQRSISQNLSEKTEKLKCAVNTKIQTLEKELKSFAELDPADPHTSRHSVHITQHSKEVLRGKDNLPFICSKSTKKANIKNELHSHRSNDRLNKDVNSAEKVVLTAREKVEGALTVARNVSASLNQHLSTSSVTNKPLAFSQMTNIGIYEVTSKADKRKEENSDQRLKQAHLPSISIKHSLDLQTIPIIQVLPGEKVVAPKVSVCAVKHNDTGIVEKDQTSKNSHTMKISKLSSTEKCEPTPCPSLKLESTINQLSKQLAQVEELREVNQTQVNHVLQFLLSRVCAAAQPQQTPTNYALNQTSKEGTSMAKALSPTSTATSSSDSKSPIAYDSLSRFLETYKKAAEQNMVAQKRAISRRKTIAVRRKKDMHDAQHRANNLLIGPFRPTPKFKTTDPPCEAQDHQDPEESNLVSNSVQRDANISVTKDNDTDSTTGSGDWYKDKLGSRKDSNTKLSSDISRGSANNPSVKLPPSPEGMTGDEYEDDWEEEEDRRDLEMPETVESMNISVEPQNEECLTPTTHSENSKSLPSQLASVVLEDEMKSLGLSDSKNVGGNEVKSPQGEQRFCATQPILSIDTIPLIPSMTGKETLDQASDSVKTLRQLESLGNSKSNRDFDRHLVNRHYLPIAEEVEVQPGISGSIELQPGAPSRQETKTNQNQARVLSHVSSGSDIEMNHESRSTACNTKRWDLQLREDLQLQSAILLNWQIEDRWKSRNREKTPPKDQPPAPTPQNDVLADIQKEWKLTLNQLDQRLKSMQDNEKMQYELNEIKMQAREALMKASITASMINIAPTGIKDTSDKMINVTQKEIKITSDKVLMKDQMVQTSPGKNEPILSNKDTSHVSLSLKDFQQIKPPLFQSSGGLRGPHRPLYFAQNEDLTAELLSIGQMGILPRPGCMEHTRNHSPSSSTTSSHQQQSSLMVSLSDGELRGSASESCGCSEGEFCLCGEHKSGCERLPPDGSQACSDEENLFKDFSQGEIILSDIKGLMKDTSLGEIPNPSSTEGWLPQIHDMYYEEIIGSDSLESELR